VAKHIRTATNIQRGSVSVMSAGDAAEDFSARSTEHEVLVIAARARLVKDWRALLSRGAPWLWS